MPVGTLGAVKGIAPDRLEECGASIMLANLYHLALRPGVEIIEKLGGLHGFSGWNGPILTDSGGYQVFSLARRRSLDDEGVTFRSHVDGDLIRFTPRGVVEMQERMGVDIAMMLDECPPWPVSHEEASESLGRTFKWARSAREAWRGETGALFGIVQGSGFEDLRRRAAEDLVELDFDGYAIGGVSVGEPTAELRRIVEVTAPMLPAEKPRYLMGVGTPLDLLHSVAAGADLFDCVLPSRNARHGVLFTRAGIVRIKNAAHREDERPLDTECSCPCCRRVSRAFLHHLFRTGEITAKVLATLHNLRFYLDFVSDLREAVASGSLDEFALAFRAGYREADNGDRSPEDSTAGEAEREGSIQARGESAG
jgi:queuine tRNA-ribosyltransferase